MILALTAVAGSIVGFPTDAAANEFIVYGVYRPIDLGVAGEEPQKDFYVNMGSGQGLSKGATLEVYRRSATYDLGAQKLHQDVTFPIATLKVIHVEGNAAIARLDKMHPADKTPAISPRTVMVGDIVRR